MLPSSTTGGVCIPAQILRHANAKLSARPVFAGESLQPGAAPVRSLGVSTGMEVGGISSFKLTSNEFQCFKGWRKEWL